MKSKDVQYVAIVNDQTFRFDTRLAMLEFVRNYRSSFNEIYELCLYKVIMKQLKS